MPRTQDQKKHIAVYMRVSTIQQNMASQADELKRWAASREDRIVWYRDKLSGKTLDRPGWKKLWEAVVQGKVSAIAVWRLDRLGRTASGLTKLFEELQARRVNLISLRDSIDLSTASGRLIANVLASVAAYETEVRGERVRAGQEAARRRGKRWGGSKKGWHYRVRPEHIEYVKGAAKQNKTIVEMMRCTGLSRPTIKKIVQQYC